MLTQQKVVVGRPARTGCLQIRALAQPLVKYNIHGRHLEVTEGLERHVKQKLGSALAKFSGASFIEGEGGIKDVDVKLMNSQVALVVRPQVQNKAMHDTYLRQGEMKVLEFGSDVYDSLDKAVASLERKLHKYGRPRPLKKDYRK
ncbi:hypothetical protein OEZ85_010822 [Tetradesmus obliquus]|uniref:Ribosomal subunit interface protein n=1 Tax=Tetradesmus obliquus TaxID=3088 RepID=A0ABY8TNE9_TETOB|nr:hypothetical protein OEZ85_010822 [Tetradesmus obliquus]